MKSVCIINIYIQCKKKKLYASKVAYNFSPGWMGNSFFNHNCNYGKKYCPTQIEFFFIFQSVILLLCNWYAHSPRMLTPSDWRRWIISIASISIIHVKAKWNYFKIKKTTTIYLNRCCGSLHMNVNTIWMYLRLWLFEHCIILTGEKIPITSLKT